METKVFPCCITHFEEYKVGEFSPFCVRSMKYCSIYYYTYKKFLFLVDCIINIWYLGIQKVNYMRYQRLLQYLSQENNLVCFSY